MDIYRERHLAVRRYGAICRRRVKTDDEVAAAKDRLAEMRVRVLLDELLPDLTRPGTRQILAEILTGERAVDA